MDDERARARLEHEDDLAAAGLILDEGQWAPSLRESTAMFAVLRDLRDMVAHFLSDGDATPFPRPVTAIDRARQQRSRTDAWEIVRAATPDAAARMRAPQ